MMIGIAWSDDVKLAHAFKLNGQAVVGSFPYGIPPHGTRKRLRLAEEFICATTAGLSSPKLLRAIFGIG